MRTAEWPRSRPRPAPPICNHGLLRLPNGALGTAPLAPRSARFPIGFWLLNGRDCGRSEDVHQPEITDWPRSRTRPVRHPLRTRKKRSPCSRGRGAAFGGRTKQKSSLHNKDKKESNNQALQPGSQTKYRPGGPPVLPCPVRAFRSSDPFGFFVSGS